MKHKAIAIFFTSFFIITVVTPSMVTILNIDCDITILVDSSEEEEKEGKEGKESSKDKDIKILQNIDHSLNSFISNLVFNQRFYSNKYTSNYLELISPPPEYI